MNEALVGTSMCKYSCSIRTYVYVHAVAAHMLHKLCIITLIVLIRTYVCMFVCMYVCMYV